MGLTAKKSLGQNFLRDTEILSHITKTAKVTDQDIIIEVGPGEGDLTQSLLKEGATVFGIEKDSRAIPFLEKKFSQEIESGRYHLQEGDALEISATTIVGETTPYKVVANIPYYITGLLIRHFLEAKHQPKSITLVVQKEVAERIALSKKESILSLSVKAYGTPHYQETIEAKYFDPAPKVDSAILHISNVSNVFFETNIFNSEEFFTLIKLGFAQKRKTLIKNLSQTYSKDILKKTITSNNLLETVRAEEISLKIWAIILTDLKNHTK